MNSGNPGRIGEGEREATAREYRRLAELLREREKAGNAAGALLYEAAKQCINAVANRRSVNPGPTGAKYRFLVGMAEREPDFPTLLDNWQSAVALHINADRLNLSESDFDAAWTDTQLFINRMLQIYSREA